MQSLPEQDMHRDPGIHRVIEPRGVLPQPAWKLDNTPVAYPTETLIDVQRLHIDSASFTQIVNACERDATRMSRHITDIVVERGKMHNPVIGSGGTLIGTVVQLDEVFGTKHQLTIGDTIVSLTSLSWLPLYLEHIHHIRLERSEIEMVGVEHRERALQNIAALAVADVIVQADATRPLDLLEQMRRDCSGCDYLSDLTINVVNVPNTEFASILLTKPEGRILFFSMATSFTVAALGAEGMARQVEMHIGNGYMPDHGSVALQLLRDYPSLRTLFAERFE